VALALARLLASAEWPELLACRAADCRPNPVLISTHAIVPASPGAGWGGCTVSLVHEKDVLPFMAALRDQYFTPLVAKGAITEAQLPGVRCRRLVWAVGRGACGACGLRLLEVGRLEL